MEQRGRRLGKGSREDGGPIPENENGGVEEVDKGSGGDEKEADQRGAKVGVQEGARRVVKRGRWESDVVDFEVGTTE